eukprot:TRINITY_DN10869_c0_g1_i1.p1 TRINITY_DN10869_c0_g1~~TRINITY_DN10869_c0_g1_i1.p1  ORF type:complete len:194 (+),score=51.18 TRINITY_DN10869_c0_g1_i1:931-1512(+)
MEDRTDPTVKGLSHEMGARAFGLMPLLKTAMAEGNYKVIRFFQTVFSALCLSYVDALVATPDWEVLEVMQKLMEYHSEEGKAVCNFWKVFFMTVSQKKLDKKICADLFEGLIKRAVNISLSKVELPEQIFLDLNSADCDSELLFEIKEGRANFTRILRYVGACVGSKTYWPLLSDRFMTVSYTHLTLPTICSV